jgi:hypothetical protein
VETGITQIQKGVTPVNRDGVKTIIGLLVIGLIIVATFLYGNSQRQAQLRQDQDIKKQGDFKVTQATPQTTPSTTTSTTSQASVPSPTANPIQGQGTKKQGTTPLVTDSSTHTVTTTPKTGPSAFAPLAILALLAAGLYYRRSRRELIAALVRTERN